MQKQKPCEAIAIGLAEAARELQVSERTLWRLAKGGEVPCQRVGKQWRFSPQALREWMASGAVTQG